MSSSSSSSPSSSPPPISVEIKHLRLIVVLLVAVAVLTATMYIPTMIFRADIEQKVNEAITTGDLILAVQEEKQVTLEELVEEQQEVISRLKAHINTTDSNFAKLTEVIEKSDKILEILEER